MTAYQPETDIVYHPAGPHDSFSLILPKNSPLAQTADGRKTVQAGTCWPANDATFEGLVLHDYDVTDQPQQAAILFRGDVDLTKLPAPPTAAAQTAQPRLAYFTAAGRPLPSPPLPAPAA